MFRQFQLMLKQLGFLFAAGVAGAMLLASGGAVAQTACTGPGGIISLYQSCSLLLPPADAACRQNYLQNHPECFGATSATAGAAQAVAGTSLQQMLIISNAASNRFIGFQTPQGLADSGQRSGLAAGGAAAKWNVWANVSDENSKYDGNAAPVNKVKSSLDVTNVVLGADYLLSPTLVFGASVAFDRASGSGESINKATGISNGTTSSTSTGYMVAPYLAWAINKELSLDGSIGWGDSDLNAGNTSGTSKRFFYGANLNYTHWVGNWQMTGKGSYLYGEEKYGDLNTNGTILVNTATKNKLDQWRLGAQASYWMNGVMPYLGLSYSTDGRSTSASTVVKASTDDYGKSAWLWSLGLNFISLKNSMTGGIVYNRESGRSNSKRDNVMANINLRF